MSISFRQLRYFVAVAEEGNFGLAARRLHISQPPITRQIQQLEAFIGAELLRRTPRGATLTEAGREFLEDARGILARVDRARTKTAAIQEGRRGTLDVSYFGSIGYVVLPEILRRYRADNLDVRTQIFRMSREEQVAALLDDRLHVAFGRYFPDIEELKQEIVLREPLALCLPAEADFDISDDNWRDVLQTIPMVLFPSQGRPNFADDLLGILRNYGLKPQVDLIAEDARAAMIEVGIGASFSIVPWSMTRLNWAGVKTQPLPQIEASSPLSILYHRTQSSRLVSSFLTSVRQYARALSKLE